MANKKRYCIMVWDDDCEVYSERTDKKDRLRTFKSLESAKKAAKIVKKEVEHQTYPDIQISIVKDRMVLEREFVPVAIQESDSELWENYDDNKGI